MAAEHEVQRVVDHIRPEDLREGRMQEVILKAHALNAPARTPDVGVIRDAIGRFGAELIQLLLEGLHRLAQFAFKVRIVHRLDGARGDPSEVLDVLRDKVQIFQQEGTVHFLAGGEQQLRRGVNLGGERLVILHAGDAVEFLRSLQCVRAQFIVKALQRTGRSRQLRC